jgi:calcineurin-like phosphoesterase family protein
MRWFTADPHFGHARINELAHRPFGSVEEMNEEIIGQWNDVVDPEDDVWILGDLALGKIEESLALVPRLNGTKVLVPGNHDRVHPMYAEDPKKREKFERMRQLYEDAGLKIVNHHHVLRLAKLWVGVSHFPPVGDSHEEDRFERWRPALAEDAWLLHGHVHEKWRQRGRWINVGVDVWNYLPVAQEQIEELISLGPQDR